MDQGDGGQVEWLDDLVEVVRRIHDALLQIGGGMPGEHTASLYAACARPFQSAFGEPIYQTPYERAAALFHAIICDHAFADGNKRTGTMSALLLLDAENSLPPISDQGGLRLTLLGQVALETASTKMTVEQVAHWIERIFAP